uniref:Signal-induced proliferation-associated 1 n=1 Tax=Ornithorhynchus anatinus TaxID=9258 RepID=A0A6I8N8N3_ORNAN
SWASDPPPPPRLSPARPAMQSDDLFARKLRQPPRPALTSNTFEPWVSPGGGRGPGAGALLRTGSDAGEAARPPPPGSPRLRSHSHEEGCRGAPTRLVGDPLVLLGLQAEEEAKFPPVPEPRWFAHHDVQSMLFKWRAGSEDGAHEGGPTPADTPASELLLGAPGFVSEVGGEGELGLGGLGPPALPPALPNTAISVLEEPQTRPEGCSLEHLDVGAGYYRKFFYGKDHQNFFGLDEELGPVAVSLRREEKEGSGGAGPQHSYRLIIRTPQLRTLRGSISEESLPPGPPRGLSPKKILEHVAPRLSLSCLRLGSASPKVPRTLLTLDEQGLSFQRKVGILYCRAGQGSEEEMYNNEEAGPALQQFLQLLGEVVLLKGFTKYRAQLDNKTDSTGTHSLYTTYQDHEIMFHVSTMLPYTPNNQQQLLRKRHIGNDIVTIVFQEPGAKPFCPSTIRSHFQHVFLVVRAHAPCTAHTTYRVAVSRTQDTPAFGPPLPHSGGPFPASQAFRAFLLAKALNGEQATSQARKFHAMAARTRHQYLLELATNEVTTISLDSASRFGLLSLGSRKRDRARGPGAELQAAGALVWGVRAAPGGGGEEEAAEVPCLLGVSAETLVLVSPRNGRVVFNCSCRDILAWTFSDHRLDLFHGPGECLTLRLDGPPGIAVGEIVARLQLVSRGCETREMGVTRECQGRLGFEADSEGFVIRVERFSFAETVGLRPGARLLRVCGRTLPQLGPEAAAHLLRSAPKVSVTVLPPDEGGRPRRSFSELYVRSLQEPSRRGGSGTGSDDPPGATLQLLRSLHLQDAGAQASLAPGPPPGLAEERTEFLHSQSSPTPSGSPVEEVPVLPDVTPDLLLAATPKQPPLSQEGEKPPDQDVPRTPEDWEDKARGSQPPSELSETFLPRTLSLRNSISKIMSEARVEPLEEEWKSISEIASTCNSILEALSKEGERARGWGDDSGPDPSPHRPYPGSLSERVSLLELTLKKLQEDLEKEKADKAALQEEVRNLRSNNLRLQSQNAAAHLLCTSQQLGSPAP